MNITTLILDRGHSTLDSNGKYITPGKQFKYPDGLHVYEGFENQKYVEALGLYAQLKGFKVMYTVHPARAIDPSLVSRVKIANQSKNASNSLFISVHNNAGGGEGTEIFTSIGNTKSDLFAESILNEIKVLYPDRKIRSDLKDGDKDKEDNFYVIKYTSMPAILIEYGFFDNRKDYEFLSNRNNIDKLAKATIDGIIKINK